MHFHRGKSLCGIGSDSGREILLRRCKIIDIPESKSPREIIADISVRNGKIVSVSESQSVHDHHVRHCDRLEEEDLALDIIECDGQVILAPGFIDWQINGALGADFSRDGEHESSDALGEGLSIVAAELVKHGVTAFCPTIVTSPRAAYASSLTKYRPVAGGSHGAHSLKLHLEGPVLARAKAGAHRLDHLWESDLSETVDVDYIHEVYGFDPTSDCRFEDVVGVVTLAPEVRGARSLAQQLTRAGVAVSIGHSNTSVEDGESLISCGHAKAVTHLFNAMSSLNMRNPGICGLLSSDHTLTSQVAYGLIADGVHVHPHNIRLAHRCVGLSVSLVTDAILMTGLPEGTMHEHAGQVVVVRDGRAVVQANDVLVGSVAYLDQCVVNYARDSGVSIAWAAACASYAAARMLGLQKGLIREGYDADLVLLQLSGEVLATIVDGQVAYCSDKW